MSSGYTRQSAAEIIPSAVVKSSSFNAELNKLRDAFDFSTDGTTGHTHDGSSDEGSYVPLIADVDGNNKAVVNTTNNRIEFYVSVSDSPVEQVRLQDGAIVPVTTNDVDLGSTGAKFKDIHLAGNATVGGTVTSTGGFVGDVTGAITGSVTGDVTGNLTGNVTAASGDSTFNNITVNGTADFTNTPLVNVSDPTLAQHAATKNYVDTSIAAVIDTAPGTLDTLNELAAALGDDPNFATTITTSIGTKVSKAGDSMTGELAMGSNKITGLGTPTTGTDATTKSYVDGILGSATSAAASAAAAAVSETNAASSYDQFDDRYLGSKASDPSVDNDGDALLTGALYWNTTDDKLKVYDGAAWNDAAFDVSGLDPDVLTLSVPANTTISAFGASLVDDADAATARTKLGLGTGATATIADYVPIAGTVTLTGGFDSDEEALGTITSGTVTPEVDGATKENFKSLTNNGAFTLAPPSTSSACCIRIHVINGASAGAITTTGFDKVFDPDTYATTNAKEYFFYIDHNATRDVLTIREIV